jgi:ribosomal protein S18 acetylase RimI-like enzyme
MGRAEVERCLPDVVASYAEALEAAGECAGHVAARAARSEIEAWLDEAEPHARKLLYRLVDPASDALIGLAWLDFDGARELAYLAYLFVQPAFRRRGYARRALALVERLVRRVGGRRLSLHTFHQDHRAMALYQGAGYTVTRQFAGPGASELTRCRLVKMVGARWPSTSSRAARPSPRISAPSP